MLQAPAKKSTMLEDKQEFIGFDSIRAVMQTQIGRYIMIVCWSAAMIPVLGWRIAALWFVATACVGAVRSAVEIRLSRQTDFEAFSSSKFYPFVAMCSNAVWAAAPVICWMSNHPAGSEVAMVMFATGYMMCVAQFNSSPKSFLLVSSPYSFALIWLFFSNFGTDNFIPLVATLPFLYLSVYFLFVFGYIKHKEIKSSERERSRLIEELEAARQVAERASEAKSMFLANMSHEIRTPMNGVVGMTELLMRTNLDERQQFYTDTIQKSGNALIAIINDILDLSKIEAGRLELEEAPFDLKAHIEEMAALMSARAREKDLELIVRIPPDLSTYFVGDGGRIRQIITNLVGNAIKFTDSGYILINATGEQKDGRTELLVEIEDTGIGIPDDKRERIFQSFQQADSSTTRHYGGTGLGLSISRLLVEAMGGEIGVRSEPNRGSTFWFKLSLENQKRNAEVIKVDFAGGDNRRVLVVDDIEVNRMIVSEILGAANFNTHSASSAQEALTALRSAAADNTPFDLLISDYLMPGMDGEMLAREIRNDPQISQTPILVLTSVDEAEHAKRIQEIGIEGFLVKPARSVQLMKTVKDVLDNTSAKAPEPALNPVQSSQAAETAPSDGRIRVLLAEDNEVNRLVVKHMLDANTYDLTIAVNGTEAFEKFKTGPKFDFILMDVSMPEMDGYEATTAIREYEEAEQREATPIICLSAHVMTKDVDRSIEVGMNDFLAKPVSQDKLKQITEKWTSASRDALKTA